MVAVDWVLDQLAVWLTARCALARLGWVSGFDSSVRLAQLSVCWEFTWCVAGQTGEEAVVPAPHTRLDCY